MNRLPPATQGVFRNNGTSLTYGQNPLEPQQKLYTGPRTDVPRTHEWFVPCKNIARCVIVVDIQRYLGPDAQVIPGHHENVAGYRIQAYRTLKSAMLEDLMLDSWRYLTELDPAYKVVISASVANS
jgi:hypothetical protein